MSKTSTALIIILVIVIAVLGGALIVKVRDGVDNYSAVREASSEMQNQATQSFNSMFINYAGSQRGSTIKSLIQSVISSNSSHYPDNQVSIEYGGKTYNDEELRRVLDDIMVANMYNVSIKYDQNGFVNKVVIEE